VSRALVRLAHHRRQDPAEPAWRPERRRPGRRDANAPNLDIVRPCGASRCLRGLALPDRSDSPEVLGPGILTEPHAVRRLLAALGLAAEPPPAPVLPAA